MVNTFPAIPNKVEKYVSLIEKIPEVKIMIQSSSFNYCMRVYNIKILNLFGPELQVITTKTIFKNKLKGLLDDLKNFKVQTILVLMNKKLDDQKSTRKFFH